MDLYIELIAWVSLLTVCFIALCITRVIAQGGK